MCVWSGSDLSLQVGELDAKTTTFDKNARLELGVRFFFSVQNAAVEDDTLGNMESYDSCRP